MSAVALGIRNALQLPAVGASRFALPAESIFARWPSLQHAQQPPPNALGERFLQKWTHDLRRWRLRVPAETPDGLVGPFRGAGDCLLPFLSPGDHTWIDPELEPAHGDFVVAMWSERFYQQIMLSRAASDFFAETGRMPSAIALKRLMHIDGAWLLCSVGSRGATAGVPLEGNARVLGVVRYIDRSGKYLNAPSAHQIRIEKVTMTDLIAPDAASEFFAAFEAGPISVSNVA